jgi:C2 domain
MTKKYRVKPCPDPDRPIAETEWMTQDAIDHEAIQPSTYWVEAGNGSLGKVYLEIISCDHLPNMDFGNVSLKLPHKDKTDAFACIVYEDVIVNTDVITNSLSPRWMPWSQRAFAFNILHPSSDVFIGIFDHDSEINPLHMASQVATSSLHDPIGRIVLNLSHFKPDTVYLLKVRACLTVTRSNNFSTSSNNIV